MAFQLIWSLDGKHVQTFALNQSASNYFCALHIGLVLYNYVLFLQSQKKKKKKGETYKLMSGLEHYVQKLRLLHTAARPPLLSLQDTGLVFSFMFLRRCWG